MSEATQTEPVHTTPADDERIVWVRSGRDRKIVQIIEPMPAGFSVTTQYWEFGEIVRQDCEVSLPRPREAGGEAAALN